MAQGEKADEAKAAGADIVGAENLVDSILAGKIEFDRCIATPDMMGLAGRVARVWTERPDAESEARDGYDGCCQCR